jgi:hypothetical protein
MNEYELLGRLNTIKIMVNHDFGISDKETMIETYYLIQKVINQEL